MSGRPYHFQRSWIKQDLRSDPANLRIMHVECDSMMPTLHDGDIVLVDLGRRSPTPPGIMAWVWSPNGRSTSPQRFAAFNTARESSDMRMRSLSVSVR
jgi:hypothetical protein